MIKGVLKIIAIFVIGVVGGIFADQILWPYFIERPLFLEYRLEGNPIYLTEQYEIYIQENIALQQAIEKVDEVVVGIETETSNKTIYGSGLIVTSDGLIVALADLLPDYSETFVYIDGKKIAPEVVKTEDGLALLKIERDNLPTLGFADLNKIKLGQRAFLMGAIYEKPDFGKMVNEGIIKYFNKESIYTDILEASLEGSALFDIEGNILGLNVLDQEGKITTIPISKIKEFLGF